MTAAHTPGPWLAGQLRTHGADPRVNGCDIGAENGANVGIAFYQPGEMTETEARANGRLFAAAPDMLAALIAISPYLFIDETVMVDAAIKKATQP